MIDKISRTVTGAIFMLFGLLLILLIYNERVYGGLDGFTALLMWGSSVGLILSGIYWIFRRG